MSLQCYRLEGERRFNLSQQTISLNVDYESNRVFTTTDNCRSITELDLNTENNKGNSPTVAKHTTLPGIVIDDIVFCRAGNYLAYTGHKANNATRSSVYIVSNWNKANGQEQEDLIELDVNEQHQQNNYETNNKLVLNSIDCCQMTGNLALNCGTIVRIYEYYKHSNNQSSPEQEQTTLDFSDHTMTTGSSHQSNRQHASGRIFKHLLDVKLTINCVEMKFLENILALSTSDHVQILKLELLTLQIQQPATYDSVVLNSTLLDHQNCSGCSTITHPDRPTTPFIDFPFASPGFSSSTTTTRRTTTTTASSQSNSSSIMSDYSLMTDDNSPTKQCIDKVQGAYDTFNSANCEATTSKDDGDFITWDLNTNKVIKLPTLMHNTSPYLSSYCVCHPMELLGPASESIACRVSGEIYSPGYNGNQLELVVLLCRQFDDEHVKCIYLQTMYLASTTNQLCCCDRKQDMHVSAISTEYTSLVGGEYHEMSRTDINGKDYHNETSFDVANPYPPAVGGNSFLKSSCHRDIATMSCFVSTLTNCYIYNLHGKTVTHCHTITYPDSCLDVRPDLLNVFILTSIGLQTCSNDVCDTFFKYDWSSTKDLNLDFMATTNRVRVLSTRDYVVLVSCYNADSSLSRECEISYFKKPSLLELYNNVRHIVARCNSLSVCSNLLTYAHAMVLLGIHRMQTRDCVDNSVVDRPDHDDDNRESSKNYSADLSKLLRQCALELSMQLLKKRQTNSLTNIRINKTIKHIFNISSCDLGYLIEQLELSDHNNDRTASYLAGFDDRSDDITNSWQSDKATNEQRLLDGRQMLAEQRANNIQELVKVYLKHANFNQQLVGQLINSCHSLNISRRLIDYLYEINQRLFMKCALRYCSMADSQGTTIIATTTDASNDNDNLAKFRTQMIELMIQKLQQLAEFDSTGIDRATVLFALANLYNLLPGSAAKCCELLDRIQPINHLVMTLCSNYRLLLPPTKDGISSVIIDNHPQLYSLFLEQLSKRSKLDLDLILDYLTSKDETSMSADAIAGLLPLRKIKRTWLEFCLTTPIMNQKNMNCSLRSRMIYELWTISVDDYYLAAVSESSSPRPELDSRFIQGLPDDRWLNKLTTSDMATTQSDCSGLIDLLRYTFEMDEHLKVRLSKYLMSHRLGQQQQQLGLVSLTDDRRIKALLMPKHKLVEWLLDDDNLLALIKFTQERFTTTQDWQHLLKSIMSHLNDDLSILPEADEFKDTDVENHSDPYTLLSMLVRRSLQILASQTDLVDLLDIINLQSSHFCASFVKSGLKKLESKIISDRLRVNSKDW